MYDGSGFRGWQCQDGTKLRTVQGTLNKAFRRRFGIENLHVTGASRTDHGVHANGQAIHFDLPENLAGRLSNTEDFEAFEYSMNRMLPDDVKIFNVTFAPSSTSTQSFFHSIASSTGKHYTYTFCTNKYVDPCRRRYCTHVWHKLDLELLESCLQLFRGQHDFAAFANRVEHTKEDIAERGGSYYTTIKTINDIKMVSLGGGYYRVDFFIQSALYRMIRNIMGASFLCSSGQGMQRDTLAQLLHDAPSRRENMAKSAPPEGLCLEKVFYAHY